MKIPDNLFLENFKELLKNCNYTKNYFLERGVNPLAFGQFDLPVFAFNNPADSAFGILFHLFFLGRKIRLKTLEKLFDGDSIDEMLKTGILEAINGSYIQSEVMIIPFKNYYFICDFIVQLEDRIPNPKRRFDYVYPVSLDSVTLSEICFKKPVRKVLDVGCGSGFLSIIASKFAKSVVGVDLNPRAIEFSEFNARLNNITNCKFICSDLYKKIKNEKFDLILSNPPYEIALNKTNIFQDGGNDGRTVLKKIMEGAPNHLSENGFCQLITKISKFRNESLKNTIKNWLKGNNIYIFMLKLYSLSPGQTAYSISSDRFTYNDRKIQYKIFSKNITKIMHYFEKIELSEVLFGLITFKKSSQYVYVEKSMEISDETAKNSSRMEYLLHRQFARFLGLYGLKYFLKAYLERLKRNYLKLTP